jgi:hypothetical protein
MRAPMRLKRHYGGQAIFLAERIRLVDSPVENSNAIAPALSAEQSAVSKSIATSLIAIAC